MKKIFINGLSSRSAGGKSILFNLLLEIHNSNNEYTFYVAVHELDEKFPIGKNINYIVRPIKNSISILIESLILLPRLIKKNQFDLIMNLSDIPIRARKQIFLFDWAYALYPEKRIWGRFVLSEFIHRRLKIIIFKKMKKYIDIIIAQTNDSADLLKKKYGFTSVEVIPNSFSSTKYKIDKKINLNISEGYTLLCLSRYYSHKNLEIFLSLGKIIYKEELDIKILLTISGNHSKGARKLLEKIDQLGLKEIIINIGEVPHEQLEYLYKNTNGLIMPTLLESFSGTYLEAMYFRRPIFTSKLPFAIEVCGKAAEYFNPNDANDILSSIKKIKNNKNLEKNLIIEGSKIISNMPNWSKNFSSFLKIFNKYLESSK